MQPTFTFSLDTEMMWGSFDRLTVARFEQRYPDLRGTIGAILAVLDEYDIPATWAVVGHLFLDRCERGADGRAHSEIVRPDFAWYPGDWLGQDPCSDRVADPLWYGDDVVDQIAAARVRHELGSHGFSHALFGDPGMSRDAARSELEACVRLAAERGIALRSFVFPRNSEGHHDLLKEFGFTSFRGADRNWYGELPRLASRGSHLADQFLGSAPQVHRPVERLPGLWDVPGSMLLLHSVGARRVVPMASRIRKAERGLRQAIDEEAVFHLWTHPMNLAHHPDAMMTGLRTILRSVADLREQGLIRTATMGDIAREASQAAARGPDAASGHAAPPLVITTPGEGQRPRSRSLFGFATPYAAVGAALATTLAAVASILVFLD